MNENPSQPVQDAPAPGEKNGFDLTRLLLPGSIALALCLLLCIWLCIDIFIWPLGTRQRILMCLLLFALLLLLGLGACLWRGLPLLTALRELGPVADGRMPQGSPVPAITCRIRRMHENMQRTRLALEESHENLRQNLRQTEKMALVGNLAAGVAHEIRNPLSSIKGYATYFGMRFPEGSEDRKAAGVMVREVERLNRVISELIGLSRPSDVRPVAAPLEDSVAHVLRLIAQDAEKRGVRLVNSLPAALPPARMDPDRLGQALLNICLNALDAMPDGGTLTLGCTVEKQHLVLSVTDTGQGIAPENLNHIFDPYFTTKGHGTGLGLATVHKIVEALEGEVYVQSRQATADTPGRTTFFIRLPQAGKAAGHPTDGPDRQAGEPADRQKGED